MQTIAQSSTARLSPPRSRAVVTQHARLVSSVRRVAQHVVRADQKDTSETSSNDAAPVKSELQQVQERQTRPVDPETAAAQRTAIITGAISVLFGIAYLALVQFMDMRGGELLPPPPEAFQP